MHVFAHPPSEGIVKEPDAYPVGALDLPQTIAAVPRVLGALPRFSMDARLAAVIFIQLVGEPSVTDQKIARLDVPVAFIKFVFLMLLALLRCFGRLSVGHTLFVDVAKGASKA